MFSPTKREPLTQLAAYRRRIEATILCRQNPITGLFPASTAISAHGDYTDAWVRDNVYSVLAIWGLGLAYRRWQPDSAIALELEQSVVKLMRGLLYCMMRQAPKVEAFKAFQSPLNALHAKYDTATGDEVVGDEEWGHLQLDATSLFLLMLAQMSASGLQIIFTRDEVNFVQNLVYYIGRTYRTPDYGIWERGNKINHGDPELNASSIGMAKAALEAMNGFNLGGARGSQAWVIHVLPDEIARSLLTLESLLPRESSSKETDSALLTIIGFPAFAVSDGALVERTRNKVISILEGKYGCKRFLRDGHQTVLEDTSRLHYEPEELQKFEHIECEWPLFFVYLMLEAQFRGDRETSANYYRRLQKLAIASEEDSLLPELYYVPREKLDEERERPHSQARLPNHNLPLVWAQSLYYLAEMLHDGLIVPADLDPLGRHRQVGTQPPRVVQIALLAEDARLQQELAVHGMATQTLQEVEPTRVLPAEKLAIAYTRVGRNEKLCLSGRPLRRLRSLTTSKVYRIAGESVVFLPSFLNEEHFYLTFDYHFLVDRLRSELAYLQRHSSGLGRPLLTILLTHRMMESTGSGGLEGGILPALLELMQELNTGICNGVSVQLGTLQQLTRTAASERIDDLQGWQWTSAAMEATPRLENYLVCCPQESQPLDHTEEFFWECETDTDKILGQLRTSENLYEQVELLSALGRLHGLNFDTGFGDGKRRVTVAMLLEEVYFNAGSAEVSGEIRWAVVRRCAGLLGKIDVNLSDAVTDILVRGKQITVGRAYSEASSILQPLSHDEIYAKICEFGREDLRDRALTQEILIYLSAILKTDPHLLKGLLILRVGYLILLLTSELARELSLTQDEAYEQLMRRSPYEIKQRLQAALAGYESLNRLVGQQEILHLQPTSSRDISWAVKSVTSEEEETDWNRWRQRQGSLNRVPDGFYPSVWRLMRHCQGIVIGDKLERRNRLDSALLLSEMTPGEKNFALQVEHLLNKIEAPEYRQATIEALMTLGALMDENPDLEIEDYLVLDAIVGHAVRLAWLGRYPERATRYDDDKATAWHYYYTTSPTECAKAIADSFRFLTQIEQSQESYVEQKVSI